MYFLIIKVLSGVIEEWSQKPIYVYMIKIKKIQPFISYKVDSKLRQLCYYQI